MTSRLGKRWEDGGWADAAGMPGDNGAGESGALGHSSGNRSGHSLCRSDRVPSRAVHGPYRAWDTAKDIPLDGLPSRYLEEPDEYLQYCEACRALAERVGLSLRNLDRALWAKSWEVDLEKLIRDLPAAGNPDLLCREKAEASGAGRGEHP